MDFVVLLSIGIELLLIGREEGRGGGIWAVLGSAGKAKIGFAIIASNQIL